MRNHLAVMRELIESLALERFLNEDGEPGLRCRNCHFMTFDGELIHASGCLVPAALAIQERFPASKEPLSLMLFSGRLIHRVQEFREYWELHNKQLTVLFPGQQEEEVWMTAFLDFIGYGDRAIKEDS